jgi:Delta24-sterol reductase
MARRPMGAALRRGLGRWLTRHRGAVVAGVALPASFAWDRVRAARNAWHARFGAAPERHMERVRRVQAQVRAWRESGSPRPMATARPEWLTMSPRTATYKRDCARIAVNLRDILALDAARGTVRVEPLVDMGQLTRFLVPRGWALKTMVEMDDLTAGGLSMGLGMETMGHRFGLWQENVRSYEIVTADGAVRTITAASDPELFHALPWSHGTLGFLTAVELDIIPVRPFVRMEYRPYHSLERFCEHLHDLACSDDAPDFLEGTVYSPSTGVIQCGWLDDAPGDRSHIHRIGRWHMPWYFEHVGSALHRGSFTEWIPLRDYYHRHTPAIFWELRELIPFGNHPLYRWLLGWLGAPKVALLKKTMTKGIRDNLVRRHVAQDLLIPLRDLGDAVRLSHRLFETYPLLVYPIRVYDHGDLQGLLRRPHALRPRRRWDMYCDLGIYGIPAAIKRAEPWDATTAVRAAEAFARGRGGCTLPWADLFMTRREFEHMFDHSLYRRVRERVGAVGAFPEVWDKVRPQHPLAPAEDAPRAASQAGVRSTSRGLRGEYAGRWS